MHLDLLLSNISQYIEVDDNDKNYLESVLISRPFRKGELIVRRGEPARHLIFANAGYLMTYYTDEAGTDHVIQFTSEGWWCGDLYSLSQQATTPFSTKGLSDGGVLLLPRLAHHELLEIYPKFEKYFRIIFHKGMLRQQLRYIEGFSTSAEERYRSFLKAYPNMVDKVPQKYIASYLGMTPEFLSRIRKKWSQRES